VIPEEGRYGEEKGVYARQGGKKRSNLKKGTFSEGQRSFSEVSTKVRPSERRGGKGIRTTKGKKKL